MPEEDIRLPEDRSYIAYVDNGDGTSSMYAMMFGGEPMQAIVELSLEEMIAEWMPMLLENRDMEEVESKLSEQITPIPQDTLGLED